MEVAALVAVSVVLGGIILLMAVWRQKGREVSEAEPSAVWNKDSLAFLDLELNHEHDKIFAHNYTKLTAGNSYLHFDSCYHPQWVKNMPKGQFCRLRQNCPRDCDYISESIHLKQKFLEKGYPEKIVDQAYTTFLPRKKNKSVKPSEKTIVRFITGFHGQYKKIEHILNKHWNVLKQDPHLITTLRERPKVTYRRASTLKNKIAPSNLKSIQKGNPLCLIPLKGMYRCNKPLCKTCNFIKHGQKSFTHKEKTYYLDNFYNCSSDYVVYCLICPCKLLYVGRTIRPLRQRFGKHRRFVEVGCDEHSVPRHFLQHHGQSTMGLWVWVIEAIPRSLPEAERFSRLCEREMFWIYTLDTLVPNGLNEELEVNPII
ncbi:transducin beta-like protein 2 isoform X2 [Lithobates pipiens]